LFCFSAQNLARASPGRRKKSDFFLFVFFVFSKLLSRGAAILQAGQMLTLSETL